MDIDEQVAEVANKIVAAEELKLSASQENQRAISFQETQADSTRIQSTIVDEKSSTLSDTQNKAEKSSPSQLRISAPSFASTSDGLLSFLFFSKTLSI